MLQLSISLMEVFSSAGTLAIERIERRKRDLWEKLKKNIKLPSGNTSHFLCRLQIRNRFSNAQKQGCWDNSWAIPCTWPPGELHRCFYCAFCLYTHFKSPGGREPVPTRVTWEDYMGALGHHRNGKCQLLCGRLGLMPTSPRRCFTCC